MKKILLPMHSKDFEHFEIRCRLLVLNQKKELLSFPLSLKGKKTLIRFESFLLKEISVSVVEGIVPILCIRHFDLEVPVE